MCCAPGGNRVPAQPDLHAGGGVSARRRPALTAKGVGMPRGGFYL